MQSRDEKERERERLIRLSLSLSRILVVLLPLGRASIGRVAKFSNPGCRWETATTAAAATKLGTWNSPHGERRTRSAGAWLCTLAPMSMCLCDITWIRRWGWDGKGQKTTRYVEWEGDAKYSLHSRGCTYSSARYEYSTWSWRGSAFESIIHFYGTIAFLSLFLTYICINMHIYSMHMYILSLSRVHPARTLHASAAGI